MHYWLSCPTGNHAATRHFGHTRPALPAGGVRHIALHLGWRVCGQSQRTAAARMGAAGQQPHVRIWVGRCPARHQGPQAAKPACKQSRQ